MKICSASVLVPVLVCAAGLAACLDGEVPTPDDTARETGEISTEEVDHQYAVILIDRTGSMRARRADGETRCSDAVTQARTAAETFFRDRDGRGVAFWLFNTAIGIQQVGTGYYPDITQASDALASLDREGCLSGTATQLADALCRVVNGFADGKPALVPPPGNLYVETDGMENASQGSCRGPSGPWNAPGTWQHNVFLAMFYSDIRTYTEHWVPSADISQLGDSPAIDVETGEPVPGIVPNATCSTQAACESAMFGQLAFWTGGLYGVVADSDLAYTCTYGTCPAPKPPQ